MQKLHKSKTPKVYKNKKLNNANFGTYNLNDYQVFLQLVTKLGKVDVNGTYQQPQGLEREHTLTAKEFSQAFGVDLDSCYRVLRNAGKKLMKTSITLERPELFVTQEINVCAQVEYQNKEGAIKVRFTEEIMPYLAQVKQKFVLYNLKEVANFGSLYSTRLYELIQEFKDTGYIIKSVAQLREVFAVGKKFKLYADFKNRTFAHAVDEINSQYPTMKLRFEEVKEGRKVVSIRFEFTPSHKEQSYNPATKQLLNVTVKPKQVQPKSNKKDDDNTPPPVHPKQQKLPNISKKPAIAEKAVTAIAKTMKSLGAEQEPEIKQALENKTSVIDASLEVIKRRTAYIAEQAKIIAESLGISKAEAYAIAKKDFEEEESKLSH